jgi:hypothetical protein
LARRLHFLNWILSARGSTDEFENDFVYDGNGALGGVSGKLQTSATGNAHSGGCSTNRSAATASTTSASIELRRTSATAAQQTQTRPPPPPEQTPAATTTVQGSVRSFSYGPAGDVNGIILEPGTEVHVPPDQATQLNSLAPVGARVQATGWLHEGPLGDTHVDATTITNLNNQNSLNFQTPPPPLDPEAPPPPNANPGAPPPPPVPPSVGPSAVLGPTTLGTDATITGVVRGFNFGPAGEVNGLILSGGTVVYFPPDPGNQVTLLVHPGARVRVRGWVRQGPAGNELLSAETITNRATGSSITLTNQPPPR